MTIIFQPYTILLLSTVVIASVLVFAVLRNRPTLGTRSFAVMMGAVGLWAFMIIFEVIATDPSIKSFSGNFKYLFIVTVPVAWFVFCLYYSNRLQQLGWTRLSLLAVVPVITLFMVATNRFHHLMFKSITWHEINGLVLPSRVFGPWFWVHTAYSYILIFLGFLFLAMFFIDARSIFRRQAVALLVAALAPWLSNVMFLAGTRPLPFLDLTPFAFAISGSVLMWGIKRYQLFDIVPIARDLVIRSMDEGILVLDTRHRIMDANPVAAAFLGVPQADLIGREAAVAIDWWSARQLDEMSGPLIVEIERDGRIRYLQISISVIHNNGRSSGHLLILRDITETKMTQDALRASQERFKSLSENAPLIILSLDESGTIVYANPAWKAILGHDRESVVGRPLDQFLMDDAKAACADVFDRVLRGEAVVAEKNVQMVSKEGDPRTFDITASVNSDDEGRITGIVCLAKDVTEERRLQEQLFQSQKMEAIGTLAGGIAHDFNNLLMGMQANVSLMYLDADGSQPIKEKLKRIEDQVQSGATLTRQLLGYARKGKYVSSAIDVHQLIEETLEVVQRTNRNIVVQHHFEADPRFINASKGQMEMVLLNLFVNAVDAMSTGGRLVVATRTIDLAADGPRWPDMRTGRYIEIQVTDNGVGMDPVTLKRIFEPFFTTKEIGRGTGLGLASVYGMVKNHHGDIHVKSSPGKGTVFTLVFPVAEKIRSQSRAPRAEAPQLLNGQKILLADDEPLVLESVGEMIDSLGYKVLRAANGKAAVDLYEAGHKDIDLVVLDMVMPDMDGQAVFQYLQSIDPDVKVLFISGYGAGEALFRQSRPHRGGMLTKPFTRDELSKALTRVLMSSDGNVSAQAPQTKSISVGVK